MATTNYIVKVGKIQKKNGMISMKNLIEELGNLKPMEMIALVKRLEKKWDVSSKPVVQEVPVEEAAPAEESFTFNVKLVSFGQSKMNVIKTLRTLTKLGLLEAKKLVEAAPIDVITDLDKEGAEQAKKELEAVGATIEI
jgi:large subunit ribosomal protein L7/L12